MENSDLNGLIPLVDIRGIVISLQTMVEVTFKRFHLLIMALKWICSLESGFCKRPSRNLKALKDCSCFHSHSIESKPSMISKQPESHECAPFFEGNGVIELNITFCSAPDGVAGNSVTTYDHHTSIITVTVNQKQDVIWKRRNHRF